MILGSKIMDCTHGIDHTLSRKRKKLDQKKLWRQLTGLLFCLNCLETKQFFWNFSHLFDLIYSFYCRMTLDTTQLSRRVVSCHKTRKRWTVLQRSYSVMLPSSQISKYVTFFSNNRKFKQLSQSFSQPINNL